MAADTLIPEAEAKKPVLIQSKNVYDAERAVAQAEARLAEAKKQFAAVEDRRNKLEQQTEKAMLSGNGQPAFGLEVARAASRESKQILDAMQGYLEKACRGLDEVRLQGPDETELAKIDASLEKSIGRILAAIVTLHEESRALERTRREVVDVLGRSGGLSELGSIIGVISKGAQNLRPLEKSKVLQGAWRGCY